MLCDLLEKSLKPFLYPYNIHIYHNFMLKGLLRHYTELLTVYLGLSVIWAELPGFTCNLLKNQISLTFTFLSDLFMFAGIFSQFPVKVTTDVNFTRPVTRAK